MKIAILGAAGAIGKATAATLAARGVTARVVGRDAAKLAPFSAHERVTADLATREGCERALSGVDAAVYALGLPYTKKAFRAYPPMMVTCLEAARQAGVRRFILVTNVYPYGLPQAPPHVRKVSEDHPRVPISVKGELRKQQEDLVLEADGRGSLRTLSLRLPNFYGPDAELSISKIIFDAALAGKKADLLGPIDTPQELVYTPDTGPVIADLLASDDLYGRPYNFAGPAETTFRQFAETIYRAAGQPPRFRVAGKALVGFMGIFMGIMRELREMMYLQSQPVLLDDTRLRTAMPHLRKTPYAEGIAQTIAALRARSRG